MHRIIRLGREIYTIAWRGMRARQQPRAHVPRHPEDLLVVCAYPNVVRVTPVAPLLASLRSVKAIAVELDGRLIRRDEVGVPEDEERKREEHREREHKDEEQEGVVGLVQPSAREDRLEARDRHEGTTCG